MEANHEEGAVKKKLYISAIVALLLINSVTLYFMFSENQEKSDVNAQRIALQENFKSLSDTLDVRNMEIDHYIGKNAELDKSIAAKQQILDQQKRQIAGLLKKGKMTTAELEKARGMIAQYEASITDLNKKVEELTLQNQQLAQANQKLSNDLNTEKQTTQQLAAQNQGLSKKVETGSLLQIAKVDIEAVKRRNNGKEVSVKKAKAAESLKISFETGENKVLDPGLLSLYVRIINPKGETIAFADQGSGTIPCESAEPCQYTKRADIDWDQMNKKVVVYWSKNIKDPGIYKVQLYQSGHVVGQGELKLS
jgi:hypothetical protein